jgi:hypothetical protein
MKALLSSETPLPAFALSYKQRQVLTEVLDVKLTSTSICPYDYHKEAASYRFALSKQSFHYDLSQVRQRQYVRPSQM